MSILLVLAGLPLLVNVDATVLNIALPILSRSLRSSTEELQWAADDFTLMFASWTLAGGSLGDRKGRARVWRGGVAVFSLASLVAALSGSIGMLIGDRLVMGIGGAVASPASLAILTNVFPDPGQRAKAVGVWVATGSAGQLSAPVLGGLIPANF